MINYVVWSLVLVPTTISCVAKVIPYNVCIWYTWLPFMTNEYLLHIPWPVLLVHILRGISGSHQGWSAAGHTRTHCWWWCKSTHYHGVAPSGMCSLWIMMVSLLLTCTALQPLCWGPPYQTLQTSSFNSSRWSHGYFRRGDYFLHWAILVWHSFHNMFP